MIHAEVLLKKRDGKDIVDVSDVNQDKTGFLIDLDEILEPHNKAMVFGIKSLMLENERKQHSFFNRLRREKNPKESCVSFWRDGHRISFQLFVSKF
ncbi:hypothetical protein HanHA300_Chr14g0537121 [Helianthus annuus]|nr:hypothetical protein HanHA300_Chr14g0537121 [Helianthus annuus]KAJ0486930.1 hypothetical protein HanHA89_Chr14g0584961 [Helianthus annuus]